MKTSLLLSAVAFSGLVLAPAGARAQAVRQDAALMANDLGPNDDGTSPPVDLGFTMHFADLDVTQVYVSNNGYVAVGRPGGEQFTSTLFMQKQFAPFFADVDTRPAGSGTVHWGQGRVDGHAAFAATWPNVGYFLNHGDMLNTFQVVLIDRSDVAAGNVDVEMNYDSVLWDCGDRECTGGADGTHAAMIGYSDGVTNTLMPGSNAPGSFVDSNLSTGLIHGHQGSSVAGRYIFKVALLQLPDGGTPPSTTADASQVDAPKSHAAGCSAGQHAATYSSSPNGTGVVLLALLWLASRRNTRSSV